MSGPDAEEYRRLRRRGERAQDKAAKLRRQLLAIPARTPRAVLLKLAIAVEAKSLSTKAVKIAAKGYDSEEMLPTIFADLRGMVEEARAA